MFKHILLPTDGSELSAAAIKEGIRFAKSIAAKVTGLCVIPFPHRSFSETEILTEAHEQASKRCKAVGERYLAGIEKEAKETGVVCDAVYEMSDYPLRDHYPGSRAERLRSHREGLPRPEKGRGAFDRQRNPKSADPFQDSRAGVSLNGKQKEVTMFKHILLPTDGSELSAAAIKEGIRFAKSIGAKVTGLCVMPLQHPFFYETEIPMEALEQAAQRCKELGEKYLSTIEKSAKEVGVACDVVYEKNDYPYEAIIRLAKQKGCDLIMMASHGRRGVGALLLGSETQKVLTHSKIPVLVYR